MPKTVIVGTETFEIPLENENPGYGEELTDFFVAVADALSTVQKPNDIIQTSANIANNISTFTSIPGFSFDTSEVRAISSRFIVIRSTVSPSQVLSEDGFIEGHFDGANWTISVRSNENAGIEFSITPAGQIQYKSSNLVGSSYQGEIQFEAKVFNQI
jgi:hypothetical protein